MDFYTSIANSVKGLIDKFGYQLIVRKPTNTGTKFDPVIAYSDSFAKGVITTFNNIEINGTSILSTDRLILMDSTIEPEVGDSIIDGLTNFRVITTTVISPAGIDLLYKVQVRV